jgi:hypothetical protein
LLLCKVLLEILSLPYAHFFKVNVVIAWMDANISRHMAEVNNREKVKDDALFKLKMTWGEEWSQNSLPIT